MGVLQLRSALALVACGILFLTGCPEPQGKGNQETGNRESKPADQPAPPLVVKAEEAPPGNKKVESSAPGEPEKEKAKDEPRIPLDKWGFAAIEKAWGLKLKSVSGGTQVNSPYTLVLEFSKDLMPEELEALKEVFPLSQPGVPVRPTLQPKPVRPTTQQKKLVVYYFDKDNVVVGKTTHLPALTEVTGVKGDAFRLQVAGPSPSPTSPSNGPEVKAESPHPPAAWSTFREGREGTQARRNQS